MARLVLAVPAAFPDIVFVEPGQFDTWERMSEVAKTHLTGALQPWQYVRVIGTHVRAQVLDEPVSPILQSDVAVTYTIRREDRPESVTATRQELAPWPQEFDDRLRLRVALERLEALGYETYQNFEDCARCGHDAITGIEKYVYWVQEDDKAAFGYDGSADNEEEEDAILATHNYLADALTISWAGKRDEVEAAFVAEGFTCEFGENAYGSTIEVAREGGA